MAVLTERAALELDGERAEAIMWVVSTWAQLARRELDMGRLGRKEASRLVVIERIVANWREIGGGGTRA